MSAAVAINLDQAEKGAKCVELARQGKSYRSIAAEVGYASPQSVANRLREHFADLRPSVEVTEDLRSLQREEICALREKLWELLADPDARLAATDRLVRLQEREARLMGLDLERNVQVNILPTAEAMASAFGWSGEDVVDVVPTEVTDA